MSNYQSSFHVIDLKLDNELTMQRPAAANDVVARCAVLPAARCTLRVGTVEPIVGA